jgi:hypothetical protein
MPWQDSPGSTVVKSMDKHTERMNDSCLQMEEFQRVLLVINKMYFLWSIKNA